MAMTGRLVSEHHINSRNAIELGLVPAKQAYSSIYDLIAALYANDQQMLIRMRNNQMLLKSAEHSERSEYLSLRLARIRSGQLDVDAVPFQNFVRLLGLTIVVFYDEYPLAIYGEFEGEADPIFVYHRTLEPNQAFRRKDGGEIQQWTVYQGFSLSQNQKCNEVIGSIAGCDYKGQTILYSPEKGFAAISVVDLKKSHQKRIADAKKALENYRIERPMSLLIKRWYDDFYAQKKRSFFKPNLLSGIELALAEQSKISHQAIRAQWLVEFELLVENNELRIKNFEMLYQDFLALYKCLNEQIELLKKDKFNNAHQETAERLTNILKNNLNESSLENAVLIMRAAVESYEQENGVTLDLQASSNQVWREAKKLKRERANSLLEPAHNDSEAVFCYAEQELKKEPSSVLVNLILEKIDHVRENWSIDCIAEAVELECQLRNFLIYREMVKFFKQEIVEKNIDIEFDENSLINEDLFKACQFHDSPQVNIVLQNIAKTLAEKLSWSDKQFFEKQIEIMNMMDLAIDQAYQAQVVINNTELKLGKSALFSIEETSEPDDLYVVIKEHFESKKISAAYEVVEELEKAALAAHQKQREPEAKKLSARLMAVESGLFDPDYSELSVLSNSLQMPMVIFYENYPPVIIGEKFSGEALVLFHDRCYEGVGNYAVLYFSQKNYVRDIRKKINKAQEQGFVYTYVDPVQGLVLRNDQALILAHGELIQNQLKRYKNIQLAENLLFGIGAGFIYLAEQDLREEIDSCLKTIILNKIASAKNALITAYSAENYIEETLDYLMALTDLVAFQWTELHMEIEQFLLARDLVIMQLARFKTMANHHRPEDHRVLMVQAHEAVVREKFYAVWKEGNLSLATQQLIELGTLTKNYLGWSDVLEQGLERRKEGLLELANQALQTKIAENSRHSAVAHKKRSSSFLGSMINAIRGQSPNLDIQDVTVSFQSYHK